MENAPKCQVGRYSRYLLSIKLNTTIAIPNPKNFTKSDMESNGQRWNPTGNDGTVMNASVKRKGSIVLIYIPGSPKRQGSLKLFQIQHKNDLLNKKM